MSRRSIFDSFKAGVNAFLNKDPTSTMTDKQAYNSLMYALSSFYDRPDRLQLKTTSVRTIMTPIINRISIDCCSKSIRHIQQDPLTGRYQKVVDSGLNDCLNYEANIDQTGRALIQDIVMSMLDEGVVAVVPTEVDIESDKKGSFTTFDITSMRVGKIVKWYPTYVDVELYNEKTARREVFQIAKKKCAIIENPLYAVMNANNSVAQRLIRKLAIIDLINEQQGSQKLDLLIKLPYTVKSELKKEIADQRRADLEKQLSNSKLGIGYIDSTEDIHQLSHPLENQIMSVVNYLTSMLYGQLGMPQEIFEGKGTEDQINQYMNTTIKPILNAIRDEFNRKFITKTARSQGHVIKYYVNPFDFVRLSNVADLGDKLTRNAIMTSNEFRDILGLTPSDAPIADELSNKNMPMDMQMMQNGYYYPGDEQYADPNSVEVQNEGNLQPQ